MVTRRATALLAWLLAAGAGPAQDATRLAPWLDLPPAWTRSITEEGVLAATPGDLPAGAQLLLLIEPPTAVAGSLDGDYDQALADLGPWRPVDVPRTQEVGNGWTFKFGIGVATLDGSKYTSLTAVARNAGRRGRFWVLADSDDTYNRYQAVVMNAVASLADSTAPGVPAASAAAGAAAAPPPAAVDPAFGQGLSGVYVGLERGLRPGAAGNAVVDSEEVDVFYPDGTYRRRLPIRGLASDLAWERARQPILWGTWRREGSSVVAARGSYQEIYTLVGGDLLDSSGRTWRKVLAPASQRLDGTWARADFRDGDAPRLALRRDGTYEDRGGFLRMVGGAWHLVVPDGESMVSRWSDAEARRALGPGAGTYTFERLTLTLRADDGRLWQINAFVPPGEDAARPARLVINGRQLLRD